LRALSTGEFKYPFDIDQIVLFLAQQVDLIFVFFEDHGLANGLCGRVVQTLNSDAKCRVS